MNRLRGSTDFTGVTDVTIKICCYLITDTQVTNSFTIFYTIYMSMKTRITARSTTGWNTNMLNIDIEIMIMRCQSAPIIKNVTVTNTNNSITEIARTRATTDIEFLRVNSFDNIRGRITNIITDTAVIWKCWRR